MTTIDDTTHDRLEQSVREIDFERLQRKRGTYHPSPASWEDQVLYFLMLDRFSDGNEKGYAGNDGSVVTFGTTPLFDSTVSKTDRDAWFAAGGTWCGGRLSGLREKLGYIRRMGVTALWISPVFRQVTMTYSDYEECPENANSYHGYGIRNFLDVDPHFGTRRELRELVDEAHRFGIYVILDIIFNHAGDVFQYRPDRFSRNVKGEVLRTRNGNPLFDPRWDDGPYQPAGFRDASGAVAAPGSELWPDGGVWPVELQTLRAYNCKGRIDNWDNEKEYLEGDFGTLKNIDHGSHARGPDGQKIIDQFSPSPYLQALCDIYRFWIAFADVDGFRIDTVKHMELGATRHFVTEIREFARSLGKENFFLLGEIAGGRQRAFTTLELTGLDAALGIDEVPDKLEYLAKGWRSAEEYFGLFRNSAEMNKESHSWFGKHVVTMFDDHDKVGRIKRRFCGDTTNEGDKLLVPALALNLATAGIPCIYYGTEQYFDGNDEKEDRALRECMFGGSFGGRQTRDRHFFDESSPAYQAIRRLADFRGNYLAIRRGRQYLRPISATGKEGEFGYPVRVGNTRMTSVVAWSRVYSGREIVLAINTDHGHPRGAWVTIDAGINAERGELVCLFSTDLSQEGTKTAVEPRNGRAVWVEVPPAGFVAWG
jgi:glycosidase